jgi:hypothetical protein
MVTDVREPWPVIRRKVHFVALTARPPTTTQAARWQQAADWPAELPSSAVPNVSIDAALWDYLGHTRAKLTRHAGLQDWSVDQPDSPATRAAVVKAVALVTLGRRPQTRLRWPDQWRRSRRTRRAGCALWPGS